MALNNKKYQGIYTKTGGRADTINAAKISQLKDLWDKDVASGRNVVMLDDPHLGPILYQMQQMQEEFDEIRRHVVDDVVGATGPQGPAGNNGSNGSNGNTGARGPAGAAGSAGAAGVDAGIYSNRGVDFVSLPLSSINGDNVPVAFSPAGVTSTTNSGRMFVTWAGLSGRRVDAVHVTSTSTTRGSITAYRLAGGNATSLGNGDNNRPNNITPWTCAIAEQLVIMINLGSTSNRVTSVVLTLA
tara:strand:+ start:31016 stop:31744 length:729 start_codon:yes stop_codon:yes gene_type:complete